ncbi:MAG: hypothetical protein NT039_02615 [Candidatus Berkelbacteria bacterium]|nr:hypothetical protein [Candidatus Berkelbacteria bacterium]
MNKRKIIIIAVIVIIIITIGVLIYLYFKNKKQKTAQPESHTIEKVINEEVFFPLPDQKNGINYISKDSKIHYFFNGKDEPGTSLEKQPTSVFWSPDASKMIYTIDLDKKDMSGNKLPLNLEYWFFTKSNSKKYKWGNGLGNISWASDSGSAFYSRIPGLSFYGLPHLIKRNASTGLINKDAEKKELFEMNLEISSGKNQIIFCPTIATSKSIIYDISSDKFFDIDIACQPESVAFGPRGGSIAFIEKNDNKKIQIYKIASKEKKVIEIERLKSNIIWSADEKFILAVIEDQENLSDRIVQIDVSTGDKKEISLKTNEKISIQKLIMAVDELFFTTNNYLYKTSI